MGETMENTAVISCAPRSVNVTVRKPSSRPREYLTEREVEKLIDTAGENRWGHRDATAILVAYRHGLRASEVVSLRWDDIDFTAGKLHGTPRQGRGCQCASDWRARAAGVAPAQA